MTAWVLRFVKNERSNQRPDSQKKGKTEQRRIGSGQRQMVESDVSRIEKKRKFSASDE